MERRLERIELLVGRDTNESGLAHQVSLLSDSLRSKLAPFPALSSLPKNLPNVEENILADHSNNIQAMNDELNELKRLMEAGGIIQDPIDPSSVLKIENEVSVVLVDRQLIREEIVTMLSAYSKWIESVSADFVNKNE